MVLRSRKPMLLALVTIAMVFWVLGVVSAQTHSGSVRNVMHCGLRPAGLTEAECLQFASRMGYEWVHNLDYSYAHSLGLKTFQWSGYGYASESMGKWMLNIDWPKWVSHCVTDKYAQCHTPYWLCLQCESARKAGLADMENRLHKWSSTDGVMMDSTALDICTKCGKPVNCISKEHVHDCSDFVSGKAKMLAGVRDQVHGHGMPVTANIWDGRSWVNNYMSRSDYAAFAPDTFFIETGPLAWGRIFDHIDGDRLYFQARDRHSISLTRDALGYLECAGVIASHNAWFCYQNYYAEPDDPPVFSNCSAQINLLRALPNWDNMNGAVSRRWYCARNYARGATASSTAATYGGRVPSKAIDGLYGRDLDDGWTGGGNSASLELTFNNPVTIRYVRINFNATYTVGIDYEIHAMVSGKWVKLVSVTGNKSVSRLHELSKLTKITRVKYQCLKSAHATLSYMQEIEVFSDNPDKTMEYRSEYSLASNGMVYSIHPYTGQAFVVFNDPYAAFDIGRPIAKVRKASHVWVDAGSAGTSVVTKGTSLRLRLDGTSTNIDLRRRVRQELSGSAFIVDFKESPIRIASTGATTTSQYVSKESDTGPAIVKTVKRTGDGWVAPSKSATTTVEMLESKEVSAVRVVFPSRTKAGTDYDIESWDGHRWILVCSVRGNTRESRTHMLSKPVTCTRMRYVCKQSADPSKVYLKSIELLEKSE